MTATPRHDALRERILGVPMCMRTAILLDEYAKLEREAASERRRVVEECADKLAKRSTAIAREFGSSDISATYAAASVFVSSLSEPQQSAQDHYTTDAAPGTTTPISGALNTSKFMGKELWVGGTINAAPDSVADVAQKAKMWEECSLRGFPRFNNTLPESKTPWYLYWGGKTFDGKTSEDVVVAALAAASAKDQ